MKGQTAYPHGMIYNEGKLYDTTFLRGYFSQLDKAQDDRTLIVFDIEGDCQKWIDNNLGTKYDRLGVILWSFGINVAHYLFCYEVIQKSLMSIGLDLNIKSRINGSKIIDTLLNMGHKAEIMQGKQFNERYLK